MRTASVAYFMFALHVRISFPLREELFLYGVSKLGYYLMQCAQV